MKSPVSSPVGQGRWTSLWVVALLSLLAQLWLCQFFAFGHQLPVAIDINPSNLWKFGYHFPPTGTFQVFNWFGVPFLPPSLTPFSLGARLVPWVFFTAYAPVMATLALLAMAAFLRELECPRPAALFGALVYAWQGDLLPFVYPGHFPYITTWPFFALAAWGALRAQRTRHWAYAVLSGACCGIMVELPTSTDRAGIACLLIAAFYLAPVLRQPAAWLPGLRNLALCAGVAGLIALAALLSLFQTEVAGVQIGSPTDATETYNFCTQFSLGPQETLTYLIPGFFGWHSHSLDGPYWGWIGERADWTKTHQGPPNFNLAISTTGTVATVLALLGIGVALTRGWLGPSRMSERQRFYGRVLLVFGAIGLVLAWGWHTPYYQILFKLPLMDKWRDPLKWLELTNFALVTFSAFGVQHLMASLDTATDEAKVVRQRVFWFTTGVLVVLGLGLLASYPYVSFVLPVELPREGFDPASLATIMSTLLNAVFWAALLMALFCGLLYALWRPGWLRGLALVNPWLNQVWQDMLKPEFLPLTLALGLTALSVVQLGWVTTHFLEPTDPALMTGSNPLLETLRSEGPAVRVSVATEDPMLNELLQNQFNTANISCMDISAASRIPDDIAGFFGALNDNWERKWFLAGVKNVAVPESYAARFRSDPSILANIDHIEGYTLVPTGSADLPSHALIVMRDYLAKATFVPRAEVIPMPGDMLARLKDPGWNPRESILLGSPPPPPPPADGNVNASAPDSVELKTYTPTDIMIEVHASQPGYILVNDQYDSDWETQIDGRNAPLLRADYLMRAVPVPAGDSVVTMHYVAHYRLGRHQLSAEAVNLFCDGAMLAAWLIAGLALWKRQPDAPDAAW